MLTAPSEESQGYKGRAPVITTAGNAVIAFVLIKRCTETRQRDWLRLAGFPVPISESDVSIVDADLSNVVTTAADKLIKVENAPDGRGSYLAHIEFQSSADAALDARVLLYNVLSRRRHGLPVWSAVFLLRPAALTAGVTGRVTDQLDAVSQLNFSYHLIRVWELAPEAVLNAGIGVVPLAPIGAVQENQLPVVVAAVRGRVVAELSSQQGKEFLLAMRILMGLKYQEQLTEKLMQSISEMEDSVEWQKIFRRGETRGEVKGEARGEARGERLALFRIGTKCFGPPSAEVKNAVDAIANESDLDELLLRVHLVANWEELLGR